MLAFVVAAAAAHTWRVRPGESIAAAVERAAAGDTIEIERGHYEAHLRIDKPLTLEGIDRPTLDGGERGDVIRVTSPDVTIEGLIVRDSGVDLGAQNAGIYLQPGAHRATVRRNFLVHNLFGLWIEKADDAVIEGNVITGKRELASAQRG
ncbi:MAG: nitrous oxide reductase family maturation protein NosD, partial [Burkholderiales bacterium]|nr:nitrous oxide reductase family maturation protein NosD [Burkholderiales bacterium]